jgi:hypothetical protein
LDFDQDVVRLENSGERDAVTTRRDAANRKLSNGISSAVKEEDKPKKMILVARLISYSILHLLEKVHPLDSRKSLILFFNI